jgi:hypothetical protein
MDSYTRFVKDRESREYSATRAQRRYINGRLRDGYDMATSLYTDKDFSVSIYTDDLPSKLTDANELYLGSQETLADLNTLFAHIALHSTVHIDALEPPSSGFRISLLREIPIPNQDKDTTKEPLE